MGPTVNPVFSAPFGVISDMHGRIAQTLDSCRSIKKADGKVTTVLCVGDYWLYSPRELVKLDRQLGMMGVALVFIDGNHEDFDVLGDRIHEPGLHPLSARVSYIGRGTVGRIGDESFLALGGAGSTDRGSNPYRVLGVGWWPQEVIDQVDVKHCLEQAAGHDIRIMFSHDIPTVGMYLLGFGNFADNAAAAADCYESRLKLSDVFDAVEPSLLVHGHLHHYHVTAVSETQTIVGLDRDIMPNRAMIIYSSTEWKVL